MRKFLAAIYKFLQKILVVVVEQYPDTFPVVPLRATQLYNYTGVINKVLFRFYFFQSNTMKSIFHTPMVKNELIYSA